jgi:hypothetical protein
MAQYTVDLPFVGPIDVRADGTMAGSAGAGGVGAILGAGAGTVLLPGVGTELGATIGGLIEQAGSLFKGKTKKVEWADAKPQADAISHQLAKGVQAALTAADFDRRAPAYIPFVENYLRTTGSEWWGGGEAKRIADELKDDIHNLYSKSSYDKVQGCMWLLLMWILTSSPADRQDWIAGYLKTHLEGAYVAYWFGTTQTPATTTPAAPTPATTTPPPIGSGAAATTDQLGKDITTYVLIAGAVILIIMTGVIVFRK